MRTSLPTALALVAGLLAASPARAEEPGEPLFAACRGCSLLTGSSEAASSLRLVDSPREVELGHRIDDLNAQIRGINTNWPSGYIVLAYAGYVLAPGGIIGGGALLAYGLLFSSLDVATRSLGAAFIAAGAVGLVVGLAGVGAIIFALVRGTAVANEAKARRDGLIRERTELERELEILRSRTPQNPSTGGATTLIPVLAF